MSESTTCPNCGAELGPEAPDALCPKCLIENAAWSQTVTVALPDDPAGAPTRVDSRAGAEFGPLRALPPIGADFGGYRIISLLGKGGMGAVYEAEQVENGRRVALKVLSHKLDSEDARQRFMREGRLAASINHPNSVYVFGTEEIEGTPAITMEIVPGGTLQEKVSRDGPMAVAQAVDAILEIVAGLESAQAIGILHRDVKPSNCFVDDQGVAKIGDFGLSISTEGRGESHLTIQGSLLGTPAFSSPEQLRGDELNARSDIYSVGATLFYLLTGHAPFEEGNMVKLLSRVLEEAPPDPRTLRPDLPKAFAAIILRCLSKNPSDRLKSYTDLRKALRPYSSESPTPATLALRFGAYVIDMIVLSAGGLIVQAAAWGNFGDVFNQNNMGTTKWYLITAGLNLLIASYFGYFEGMRGASFGKKMFRLRLVRSNGSLAGFGRAFSRALLLILITSLPFWTSTIIDPGWMGGEYGVLLSILMGAANLLTFAILFCMARRHNGFAGLHGLATDTRVLRAPAITKRPALSLDDSPVADPLEGAEDVGPYHVIEPLGTSGSGRWFLAFDTKLLRRVRVHQVEAGTPPVAAMQRNLNRQGRLRWITGRRSQNESWDAYEAPAGKALSVLLAEAQPWSAVRFWLLDLAEEFTLAEADGTMPNTLSFNRVWVTADGYAKLLDFPAPGTDLDPVSHDDPQAFLRAIGQSAVGAAARPVPLHARTALFADQCPGMASLLEMLRLSIRRPATISRRRRLGITIGVSLFPLLGLSFAIFFISLNHKIQKSNPELMDLGSVTMALQMEKNESKREAVRREIAVRFGDLIEDPETWTDWRASILIDPRRQRLAKEAVADYPDVVRSKGSANGIAGEAIKNKVGAISKLPPVAVFIIPFTLWIFYGAVPSLLMALIMRRGLILVLCGAVVVNAAGERASRGRALWRGLLAWSPLVLGALLAGALVPLVDQLAATVVVLILIVVIIVLSHLRHGRSLHDRLAKTWLVPR